MNQMLIPVLLLATAAASSSNELPLLSTNQLQRQQFGLKSQQNDNIFSNSQNIRNILEGVLYKIPPETPENGQIDLKNIIYNIDGDNNQAKDNYNIINKNENYNGEGFRKEQWHNYPRQLDRLHDYIYEEYNVGKRNLDPDQPGNEEDNAQEMQYRNVNDITNEFHIDTDADSHNIYDEFVATTNPLLILKIRLACLSNNIENTDANQYLNHYPLELERIANDIKENNEQDESFNDNINKLNPILNVIKVKRKSSEKNTKLANKNPAGDKAVTKRIFSLWSRLQSLNHKGHELLHRRHLHAFYGMPDSDGSGVLTAETRATLMRPPGSPLRWG